MKKYMMNSKEQLIKASYVTVACTKSQQFCIENIFFCSDGCYDEWLVLPSTTFNGKPLVNVNDQGVILDGYDAVAFFTDNKPVKGGCKISVYL